MAFNLFPQTDFRQIDLNWVLAEVKRAANLTDRVDGLEADVDSLQQDLSGLTGRVDGLSAEIRDPETGLWKAISDIHAANSSQQAQINALIAAQVFARPEDYGAAGDGVADDTAALQAAFNSDKPVFLGGVYGITDTIHINKDKLILCGETGTIKTLSRVTRALVFGDDPTTGPDAGIPGLIQVLWYGGTLTCDVANYFDYGFTIYRCLNSYFYGVSVTNCVGTGFNWAGTYGASSVTDNCIVRGPSSGYYGVCGFLAGRNDQRIYNCSAVDMTTGFYADRGYVRFEGCYCWLTRTRDDTAAVVGYDIVSTTCAVIDCTCDTIPTGIKLHPTATNFYASALSWLSSTTLSDAIDIVLVAGSEANVSINGFIVGVQSMSWARDVTIFKNVTGVQLIGFTCGNVSHITDYDTSVTQLMPNYHGTNEKFLSGANGVYEWKAIKNVIYIDVTPSSSTHYGDETYGYWHYIFATTDAASIYATLNEAQTNNQIVVINVNISSPTPAKKIKFILTQDGNEFLGETIISSLKDVSYTNVLKITKATLGVTRSIVSGSYATTRVQLATLT